jgi:hypothetical protein
MSFTHKVRVFIRDELGFELTNEVLGASIDATIFPAEQPRSSCTITLDNHDGRFTPDGTGTFSNFDWFSQPIEISFRSFEDGVAIGQQRLFIGLVNDIAISQTSIVESTVELSCVDFFTVAGRGSVSAAPTLAGSRSGSDMFRSIMNGLIVGGNLIFEGAKLPRGGLEAPTEFIPIVYGQKNWDLSTSSIVEAEEMFVSFESVGEGRVADPINQTILPSGPSTFAFNFYDVNGIVPFTDDPNFGKTAPTLAVEYFSGVFTRPKTIRATPTYLSTSRPQPQNTLPVLSFQKGFNIADLINNCQMTMPVLDNPDITADVSNDVSVGDTGVRNISFSKIADPFGKAAGTTAARTAILNRKAGFWTKRFSTNRYDLKEVTVSALSSLAAADVEADVFDFEALIGLELHTIFVDDNPYVTVGKKMSITPTDINCSIPLVNGYDLLSLIVGEPVLGVLGKMRIG